MYGSSKRYAGRVVRIRRGVGVSIRSNEEETGL